MARKKTRRKAAPDTDAGEEQEVSEVEEKASAPIEEVPAQKPKNKYSGRIRVVVVRPGYLANKRWKVGSKFALTVGKSGKIPSWVVPESEYVPPAEPADEEVPLDSEVSI